MSAEHSEQSGQGEDLPDSCKDLIERLREIFPGAVGEATTLRQYADELTVRVAKEQIIEVCRFLKADPQLAFDYLSDLSGVDYPDREKRFEVVYHLYSIPQGHRVRLKVQVAEGEAVPSVSGIWRTADWHEREAYDLLGILFEGHPDLRRILLPEDWNGHPLRKEYPLAGYDEN